MSFIFELLMVLWGEFGLPDDIEDTIEKVSKPIMKALFHFFMISITGGLWMVWLLYKGYKITRNKKKL